MKYQSTNPFPPNHLNISLYIELSGAYVPAKQSVAGFDIVRQFAWPR